MKRDFFIILGGEGQKRRQRALKPANSRRPEPNLEILKESPCLRCKLFVKKASCPYVKGCSKIDEFQRIASTHCTLCKPYDMLSIAKI